MPGSSLSQLSMCCMYCLLCLLAGLLVFLHGLCVISRMSSWASTSVSSDSCATFQSAGPCRAGTGPRHFAALWRPPHQSAPLLNLLPPVCSCSRGVPCRAGTRPEHWRALAEASAAERAAALAGKDAGADAASAESTAAQGQQGAQPGPGAASGGDAGAYGARVAMSEASAPSGGWWGRRQRRDAPAPAQPTGAFM